MSPSAPLRRRVLAALALTAGHGVDADRVLADPVDRHRPPEPLGLLDLVSRRGICPGGRHP